MRLIAVPLARARPGALPVSTFIAQRTPHAIASPSSPASPSSATASATDAKAPPEPLMTRMLNKASNFWMDLGTAKSSPLQWKRRTYDAGEKLMDRIEYEEWALKGVDPTANAESREEKRQGGSEGKVVHKEVPLLFPPSLLQATPLVSSLRTLTRHRTPHHRQRLIWCLIGMPITLPFALVPVVPNLPFFYLVWRAYSHWKAFKSSQYLSELIEQGKLVPKPSKELDEILALPIAPGAGGEDGVAAAGAEKDGGAAATTPPAASTSQASLILGSNHISVLAERMELEKQTIIDLGRALKQTRKSIREGKIERLEAAAKGEAEGEGNKDGEEEKRR